jgi:7,8-dihydroneopterin aldolase/epimerase/oxygenase
MMDKIFLSGISCAAHIGVLSDERETAQQILVDLVLHLDLKTAAGSDQLEGTVDYFQLVEKVEKTAEEGHFHLLETLAARLCKAVLQEPRISSVQVTVRKFPESLREKLTYVAVEMTRTREEL